MSRVVLGAMARRQTTEQRFASVVDAALDAGIDGIDTAPLYGFGESETWVGRALAGRRDRVVLMTKVGLRWDGDHGEVLFPFTGPDGVLRSVRRDGRPESVVRELEASLRRLGVGEVDLVQVHHPDRLVPIEDTLGALADQVRAGKAKAVGISNFSVEQGEAAIRGLSGLPLAATQMPYSLLDRGIEAEVLPWARSRDVGVLAYSPLAAGALAGRYLHEPPPDSWDPMLRPDNLAKVHGPLSRIAASIAKRRGASLGAVAAAWLLNQPGTSAIITGASSPEQVRALARAGSLVLDPEELSSLGAGFLGLGLDLGPSAEGLGSRIGRRLRGLGRRGRAVVRAVIGTASGRPRWTRGGPG